MLEAAQQIVDSAIGRPVLIGDRNAIETRLKALGLGLRIGEMAEVFDRSDVEKMEKYYKAYHSLMGRLGVSPVRARHVVNTRNTTLASLMLKEGDVDAVICGAVGPFVNHVNGVDDVIGKANGVGDLSTLVGIILPNRTLFICDSHITLNPTAEELAEMALLSAEEVKRFGIEPKIAFLSHSNFGTTKDPES